MFKVTKLANTKPKRRWMPGDYFLTEKGELRMIINYSHGTKAILNMENGCIIDFNDDADHMMEKYIDEIQKVTRVKIRDVRVEEL